MSHAVFQRTQTLKPVSRTSPTRPIPRGYGLVAAAALSLGMWGGIFWMAARWLG